MNMEQIILGIITMILWPVSAFFAVNFFKGLKDDIGDLKKEFKEFCENTPCTDHAERIAYIEGKSNGKGARI